jgi:hypothetical protein
MATAEHLSFNPALVVEMRVDFSMHTTNVLTPKTMLTGVQVLAYTMESKTTGEYSYEV